MKIGSLPVVLTSILLALQPWVNLGLLNNQSPLQSYLLKGRKLVCVGTLTSLSKWPYGRSETNVSFVEMGAANVMLSGGVGAQ